MFDAPETPESARALLKRLGLLKQSRVLEGTEREKTFTMLRVMPSTVSTINTYGAKLGKWATSHMSL